MTETLLQYATNERIALLLAKERAKLCRHNKSEKNPLLKLMPSRADWEKQLFVPEQFRKIPVKGGKKRLLYLKHFRGIVASVNRDLQKHSEGESDKRILYIENLLVFCDEIRSIIESDNVKFHRPLLLPVLKKEYTYRPLSVYTNLRDKIIIGLLTDYLTKEMDPLLHEDILSYRPMRRFHGRDEITTSETGVRLIKEFRKAHQETLYVADCDIRNFYDTIAHAEIRRVVNDAMKELSFSDEGTRQVNCIVDAYLGSYNFFQNVLEPSRDKANHPAFWHQVMKGREIKSVVEGEREMPDYKFGWVEDELARVYDDDWDEAKYHIGIPQGGALSLFFANIVLNDVDKPVLAMSKGNTLFCRYCDDMVLMNTDERRCRVLIDEYVKSLESHKLIPHKSTLVSSCKNGKKITKDFWDIKSHSTYLWGSGNGDASHWVGFLGYEMNNNGETRMRRSSLEKHKTRVNQYSYGIIRALKNRKNAEASIDSIISRICKNLNHYADRLKRSESICSSESGTAVSWERQYEQITVCIANRKIFISTWLKRHPHLPLTAEDRRKLDDILDT